MKDYKLSEIKSICEMHENCKTCPFHRKDEFIKCIWNDLQGEPCSWRIDKEVKDENNQ